MKEGEKIGRYVVERLIGKGGMGEVFLAFDPICDRKVAIKRIRTDLKNRGAFKGRFLREAKITAGLTHPGVITIYSIVEEGEELYYTMPYVEGKTFKQLLQQEETLPIQSLLPIFKSLCQTIAYVHSKGIIHRDLKPENVLVGNFGEVILLDWGLAESPHAPEIEGEEERELFPDLTHPGKIVGTLAYMAPERALSNPATMQTDLYALGVILYQLLTLHLPFERGSLKEFRKNHAKEKLIDPEEMAPYRDVPLSLSRIAKKALSPHLGERYKNMEALISDLLNHMEGKSEWFKHSLLDTKKKSDWEFQENLLITKDIAITRGTDSAEWVSLMISKASFAENTRLETKVYIKKEGAGIGLLLSIPEVAERTTPFEGYCLWLGTQEAPLSKLFRNTVEVLHLPDLFLQKERWHHLIIEKSDQDIHFILDHVHKFKYVSYLPLSGTHVGIMAKDDALGIDEIVVSISSHPLQVSCLSIPDTFLSNRDYKRALAEYRRIGNAFPGHAEGREALFRAGITLLEQAKNEKTLKKGEKCYQLALEEFEKLHKTPGAPLEYLGKALVYEALHEREEEINCLELALRRYPHHPLLPALQEQVVYRMHETASCDRYSAYRLILIALTHCPLLAHQEDHLRLFRSVIAHGEPLPFEENPLDPTHYGKEKGEAERKQETLHFAAVLAFWLAKPYLLAEIFEEVVKTPEPSLIGNILYFLFDLGAHSLAETLMGGLREGQGELAETLALLTPLSLCHSHSLEAAIQHMLSLKREDIGVREFRTWSYLMQNALYNDQEEKVEEIASFLSPLTLSREDRILLDAYRIWACLARDQIAEARKIFETYTPELLNQETTLLHPLFGCYLYATEGQEIAEIYFAGVIDTPFPRSWALLGHELTNHLSTTPEWYDTSFLWERRCLYRQLTLYYTVTKDSALASFYRHLSREEGAVAKG